MIFEAKEGETILTLKQLAPVRLLKNQFYDELKLTEKEGVEKIKDLVGKGRSKRGIFEGDLEQGELEIGQISASIIKLQTAEEITSEIWNEFLNLKKSLAN